MTVEQVVKLMGHSKSKVHWDKSASKVKEAFGGEYPDFWWSQVVVLPIFEQLAKDALAKVGKA